MSHFCSCTDHKCPFNPHNPKNQGGGCDLCITKCLKNGEIPSCFFKDIDSGEKPEVYTYRGFAEFVIKHQKD